MLDGIVLKVRMGHNFILQDTKDVRKMYDSK